MDPVLSLHREWCAAAADGGGDFTSRDGSGVSTWNGSWTAVPRPGVSKSKWKKKSRATAWCNDGGSTSAVPPKNYSRTPQKATGPWCLCITVSQGGFKHVLLGLFVELNPRNRSVNQFRSSLTKQEGVYRGQTLNGNISRRDQSKVLTSCNHMNRMTNCPHSACQPDRPF